MMATAEHASQKVVDLRGGSVHGLLGEPNPKVVELLEDWLAQARGGQLRSIIAAAVIADGTLAPLTLTQWAVTSGDGFRTENALMRLVREYGRWLDE